MIVGLCVDAHFMRFSHSGVRRQYFAGLSRLWVCYFPIIFVHDSGKGPIPMFPG